MKVCPLCKHVNNDSDTLCAECNYPLPSSKSSKNTGKKTGSTSGNTSGKKPIAAILAAVVAVGVLVTAVTSAVSAFSAKGKMAHAFESSADALLQEVSKQSGISGVLDYFSGISELEYHSIELYAGVEEHVVSLDVDCARVQKLMTGTLSYENSTGDIDLDANFYMDKKDVRFVVPGVVSDVYGFSIKDFNKKYENSSMRKILGLPSAQNLDLAALTSLDVKGMLKQPKKLWDKFYKTLKAEKMGERPLVLGGTTQTVMSYDVSWDAKAMRELVKSLFGGVPSGLTSWLTKLDPDCRCFVNDDGMLVGIDFVAVGNKCTLLLEGTDNLWDDIRLEIQSLTAAKMVFTGGVVHSGNSLRIALSDDAGNTYALNYNSDGGRFSLDTPMGTLAEGIFYATSDTLTIGYENLEENMRFTATIRTSDERPDTLKGNYVDLLDMNLKEWQRFLIEVINSNG
jgi:hypothetical protein